MANLGSIVLDCTDRDVVAPFWAEVLGYVRRDDVDQYAILTPAQRGGGPAMLLQQVAEAKAGKNRMHLDVRAGDIEAEAERLTGLGATRTGEGNIGEHRWITMADPEGNEFCVAQT